MKITQLQQSTTTTFASLGYGDVFIDKNDDEGDICLRVSMGDDNAVRLRDGLAFSMDDGDPVLVVDGEFVVKTVG